MTRAPGLSSAKKPGNAQAVDWRDRAHFFAVSAKSMRRIPVNVGVSAQTVLRDWRLARAWLAVELRQPGTRGT